MKYKSTILIPPRGTRVAHSILNIDVFIKQFYFTYFATLPVKVEIS